MTGIVVARNLPDTLVLSGGGARGVSMLGAVHKLQQAGTLSKVRTVVGTSAGAIVGALVATRRNLPDAFEVICRHGYEPDFSFDAFTKTFGLDSGKCIDSLVGSLLEGPLTFADVKRAYNMRLVVCVTNLTDRQAEYIGPDTHPDFPVALALRMSCSIPLYFQAVQHCGKWYVDGSIADNFACKWAADNGATRILGVMLRPASSVVASFESFVLALVESVAASQPLSGADILNLEVSELSSFHFGASRDQLAGVFVSGVKQADAFVKKRQ